MMIQTSTTKKQVRDLGIMMSNTATFMLHIRNIVKKARDKIGWMLRVFQSRQLSLMLTVLKSLVIPQLEYCCQLWNPWKAKHMQAIVAIQRKAKDMQAIEAIQRTFTYKITEVQQLKYWERLHEFKLYSLQRRLERYIIIYIWKITHYMVPNVDRRMGHKIKNQKTPKTWNTVRYSVSNK